MEEEARCPCGTGDVYAACCGPIIGGRTAPTAERLMRSRYTAFARREPRHLLRSWHPTTRPEALDLDETLRWLSLEVLATDGGGPFEREGVVVFEARFREGKERGSLRERSRFVREDREWLYVDGMSV